MHEWRYIALPGSRERQSRVSCDLCWGQAELCCASTASSSPSPAAPAPPGCALAKGIALAAPGEKEDLFCRSSLNMGCSLCTLQKPEEQYKLLYEVCQVKGWVLFLKASVLFWVCDHC